MEAVGGSGMAFGCAGLSSSRIDGNREAGGSGGDLSRCPFLNGTYGQMRKEASSGAAAAVSRRCHVPTAMAYREDNLADAPAERGIAPSITGKNAPNEKSIEIGGEHSSSGEVMNETGIVDAVEKAQQSAKVNGCPFHSENGSAGSATNYGVEPERLKTSAEENLRGFIKTRGSLRPGDEFVFWWVGDIYAMVDEQPSKHLFAFEGYNIGRMARVDGGWRLLTREVGLYKHPLTGEILGSTWDNPLTGQKNNVVHCWNDPVNQQFLLKSERGEFKVPTTVSGDDVLWNAEVFLNYPSPLPRAEFPDSAQSDRYQSAELFQFYTKQDDLRDPRSVSAPCLISWVRVGQWLPWMNMGDREGRLVYHCRGKKLENGYEDLSTQVKQFLVTAGKEEFAQAPLDFSRPNETSWTYFKKLLRQKGAPRADGTSAVDGSDDENGKTAKVGFAKDFVDESEAQRALVGGESAEKKEIKGDARMFTQEELSKYDGTNVDAPLLLSICGRVYDVTRGRKHYRKGETYNSLTGVDATAAFVNGSMIPTGARQAQSASQLTPATPMSREEIDALPEDKKQDLEHWIAFFDKEYELVGELADL